MKFGIADSGLPLRVQLGLQILFAALAFSGCQSSTDLLGEVAAVDAAQG